MSVASMPRAMSPARLAETVTRGKWHRARHLKYINGKVVDLLYGHLLRLACFAPPRHGKSDLLSIYTPLLFLGTWPDKQVILASHSAELAIRFGRQVRDLMEEWGPKLFGINLAQDHRATDNWGIDGHKGGMRSIGVGGSLIGEGADLLIFDDIIPDSTAALSETIRNNTHDWYLSTARTRLNVGGKEIFTMQRWHDDDPAARIVFDDLGRWGPPRGCVINLPAIAEENDEIGREPGEPLWPSIPNDDPNLPPEPRWPLEKLEDIRKGNEFWFAGQYQQRPVPRGGGMFKAAWFLDNIVRYRPREAIRIRWWDRAASDGSGDYTVGVLMSRKDDCYYIEDVVRGQWPTTERDRIIRATCKEDNARYPNAITTWAEQEPGSAGKDSTLAFEKMLAGYAAHCETSTGEKVVRADAYSGACGRGDVRMCYSDEWNDAYVHELSTFPFGKKDDQVDASSGAYNKLALAAEPGGYAAMSDREYVQVEAEYGLEYGSEYALMEEGAY